MDWPWVVWTYRAGLYRVFVEVKVISIPQSALPGQCGLPYYVVFPENTASVHISGNTWLLAYLGHFAGGTTCNDVLRGQKGISGKFLGGKSVTGVEVGVAGTPASAPGMCLSPKAQWQCQQMCWWKKRASVHRLLWLHRPPLPGEVIQGSSHSHCWSFQQGKAA